MFATLHRVNATLHVIKYGTLQRINGTLPRINGTLCSVIFDLPFMRKCEHCVR